MSVKCDYYVDGKCFSLNGRVAIYEVCVFEKIAQGIDENCLENLVADCNIRKAIKILEARQEKPVNREE